MEDFITLRNQRGIAVATGELVADRKQRVRQIFKNLQETASRNNSNLQEVVRLVVMVSDMDRDRPLVNEVQREFWGERGPFPCRTIIEVDYLAGDFIEIDIVLRIGNKSGESFTQVAPKKIFTPTGPWSLGIKTKTYIFVSGMRGIDPETNQLVVGEAPRIRQAFYNLRTVTEAAEGKLANAVALVIYTTDEKYFNIIEMLQNKFWEGATPPPTSINICDALNDRDVFEIEGTFIVE